jgi:hypothetical protein
MRDNDSKETSDLKGFMADGDVGHQIAGSSMAARSIRSRARPACRTAYSCCASLSRADKRAEVKLNQVRIAFVPVALIVARGAYFVCGIGGISGRWRTFLSSPSEAIRLRPRDFA